MQPSRKQFMQMRHDLRCLYQMLFRQPRAPSKGPQLRDTDGSADVKQEGPWRELHDEKAAGSRCSRAACRRCRRIQSPGLRLNHALRKSASGLCSCSWPCDCASAESRRLSKAPSRSMRAARSGGRGACMGCDGCGHAKATSSQDSIALDRFEQRAMIGRWCGPFQVHL